MTDKQIIIDGEYWRKKYGDMHIRLSNKVAELEEQLKRKEQECERLKEEVSLLKESNSKLQQIEDVNSLEKCYLQQLDQLKEENEELKKDLDFQKNMYECARADEEDKFEEILELKQTLTEIKQIAKHFIEKGLEPQSVEHQLKLRGKEELAKIILQKCEVLDER